MNEQASAATWPVMPSYESRSELVGQFSRRSQLALQAIGQTVSTTYRQVIAHPWTVPICCLLIGLVSAYDTYLTIKYAEYLQQLELNPIGRWLMDLDRIARTGARPDLSLFLGAKFAGTVAVVFALQTLMLWKRELTGVIATKVAAFQVALFCFLSLYPPH